MWRVAVIVLLVLILDAVLLLMGCVGPLEMNQLDLMRAYRAQADNPTPETQHALERLQKATWTKQMEIGLAFSAGVLVVTAAGFFIAGRSFERDKVQARRSTSPGHVTPYT
jgi:hypothetical protein